MTRRSLQYRPDIDGLRAVAVVAVVAYHAFPMRLPGGFVGVDVFFVISGYLITGIILNGLHAGQFSFKDFYARRIRRIFPALALVLAAVLAIGWFRLFAAEYQALGRHVVAGAAFGSNLLFWQEASYFDRAAALKPLLHLWSLGIEEQFYLVWPLLLVMSFRWARGPLCLTLALGALSFTTAILTVRVDPTAAFYAPWTRFWELLAGAALVCAQADAPLRRVIKEWTSRPWVAETLSVVGISMLVAAAILIDEHRIFPGLWVVLPVAGTVLLLIAGSRAHFNRIVLSHPVVVWIGLISYPLYLWHWPLLSFTRSLATVTPPAGTRLLAVAVSVALAWTTYRVVESPARFGAGRRLAVPIVSVAMTLIAGAGAVTYARDGFRARQFVRSDAAHFVEYYELMRKHDIADAYRAECDFMDWQSQGIREAIDPSCTTAGREHTVFLWGDSFAQALSLGIREQLPAGAALAQVATSGCRPALEHFVSSGVPSARCDRANDFAVAAIRRLRPALAILAQQADHTAVDWKTLTAQVLDLGARSVLVVGPLPQWRPTLPGIFSSAYLKEPRAYIELGLERSDFDTDRRLSTTLVGLPGVTYLSALDQLCREDGCLAQVPGEGALDLMVLDFGHLTPKGSSYLGRKIWKPVFDNLLR
jgi:peptidoglycan/LPS O-acetylase OafA/YrhL